ncbi:MAG: hypothetical protein AVDCRST_MAG66-765, partial [uncultured Pseudonocardia sp.]
APVQETGHAGHRGRGRPPLREEQPGEGEQVPRPGRRLRRQADEGQVPHPDRRRRQEGEGGGGHPGHPTAELVDLPAGQRQRHLRDARLRPRRLPRQPDPGLRDARHATQDAL